MTDPMANPQFIQNRRHFFGRSATGIGAMALSSLLGKAAPTYAPRAKRVIYLFQSGAPSQMDLLDYKPSLKKLHGQELPGSIRMGQRLTGMTARQKSFAVADAIYGFQRCGKSGLHLSTKLPYTGAIADDLCVVNSMFTEAINHDPAITFIQTGHQQPGRPSIGAWFSYGLGAESDDLPAFVVMLSKNTKPSRSTTGCGAAVFCLRITKVSNFAPKAIRYSISMILRSPLNRIGDAFSTTWQR